jgi:phosphate transport system permease protein
MANSYRSSQLREFVAMLLIWLVATLVVSCFALLLGDLVRRSWGRLSWQFLVASPRDAGRAGGIASILVSTGLILAVCLMVALPTSVGTAVLLTEFTSRRSRFGQSVRWSLDMLAGVPPIVFGLFGNAFFGQILGLGFSILSGGLTLACMVLPILTRATEAGLRTAPDEYRLSAAALGLTRSATLAHLLLPAALPGIVVGLVLGLGRAMAETSALLFTSGYVDRMPESLWDSGRSLSIHIFDLAMNVPGGEAGAASSALILVSLLLLIDGIARWLSTHYLCKRQSTR